jgi:putative tryptophan/tyrosine transport system substrate-binding protein
MVTTQDPVAARFINSLAKPGGNITGGHHAPAWAKWKTAGIVGGAPGDIACRCSYECDLYHWLQNVWGACAHLKIQLQSIGVRGPNPDLQDAFQAAVRARAGALITISNAVLNPQAEKITELAIKNRLPSLCEQSDYVEVGGLMSYSADEAVSYKRAAIYVDKILKGAKPADLPVEQATGFELVINLKTAKALSVTIPLNVLARADKVIK